MISEEGIFSNFIYFYFQLAWKRDGSWLQVSDFQRS